MVSSFDDCSCCLPLKAVFLNSIEPVRFLFFEILKTLEGQCASRGTRPDALKTFGVPSRIPKQGVGAGVVGRDYSAPERSFSIQPSTFSLALEASSHIQVNPALANNASTFDDGQ